MPLLDYRQGMDFGTGVHGLTGEPMGDAVARTPAEDEIGAAGQTVSYAIDKVETFDQVEQVMGLSGEADGTYGLFNASLKASWAHNASLSVYGVYLVVSIIVQNSFRQMRDVQFKPEIADLLRQGQVEQFRKFAGDGYVRGKQTGGEFYALLTIQTESQAEQTSVSEEMSASYGFAVTKISAQEEFSDSLTKLHKQSSLSVRSFQRGGSDTSPVSSIDGIIERARTMPAGVVDAKAVDYAVLQLSYDTVFVPGMPSLVDIEQAKEALTGLAQTRNDLWMALNTIDFILQHPTQFKPFDASVLNQQRTITTTALNQVIAAASRISHDIAHPDLPQLTIPDLSKLPARIDGSPVAAQPPPTTPDGPLIREHLIPHDYLRSAFAATAAMTQANAATPPVFARRTLTMHL